MSEELYESTWHIVHDDGRAWEDDELEDLISAELRGVAVTASGVIFAIDKSLQAHMLVEDVEVVVDTWHLEHEDGREWTREELDRIVGQYLELDEDPSYKLSLDERECLWVIPDHGYAFEFPEFEGDVCLLNDMVVVWDE